MAWKSQDEKTLQFKCEELEMSRKIMWNGKNYERLINFIGPKDNITALDIGCGTGYIIRQIGKHTKNSKLFGVDISDEFIEAAKSLSLSEKLDIKFIQDSVYTLPFPDEYFDLVTSQFVLLNLESPDDAIDEVYRVLKHGGKFVCVETPSNTRLIYDSSVPGEIIELEHLINKLITDKWGNKGVDKDIGLRIPELFKNHHFKQIDIEGYFNIKLGSYPYVLEGIKERALYMVKMLERQERRLSGLVEDGLLTEQQKEKYMGFYRKKRNDVYSDPSLAMDDMSIHGSLCLMTSGIKQVNNTGEL